MMYRPLIVTNGEHVSPDAIKAVTRTSSAEYDSPLILFMSQFYNELLLKI